jgi:hypothetical protein
MHENYTGNSKDNRSYFLNQINKSSIHILNLQSAGDASEFQMLAQDSFENFFHLFVAAQTCSIVISSFQIKKKELQEDLLISMKWRVL